MTKHKQFLQYDIKIHVISSLTNELIHNYCMVLKTEKKKEIQIQTIKSIFMKIQ